MKEVSAYERTRHWVLSRTTPLGATIDVEELATALRTAPALIHNALIRLTAESLVRRDEGVFTPAPMTADLVDNLYTARLTIETGVIESYLATFSNDHIARIVALSNRLFRATTTTHEEFAEFLDLSTEYHTLIVSGAGSAQLTAAYRELNVQTVWRETYEEVGASAFARGDLVPAITKAIIARDVAAAKEAIRAGVEHVRRAAIQAIAIRGGAV